MKLDNIIYDVESLSTALTEQWQTDSPTFSAMYPSDTSTSLANVFAAYGSMLQYGLVSAMANCYTTTAFSEMGIRQLADTLGNAIHGNVSSQVKVTITKNNFKGINVVIPAESSFEISGKKFFNPTAILIPSHVDTVYDILLLQGELLTVTKTTSGIENEKFYFSSDFKANHSYTKVYVNNEEWSIVESFIPYDKNSIIDPSELNCVILRTDPDGRAYVKVGNNQLGIMPAQNSTLQIKYASNDGQAGNLGEIDKEGTLSSTVLCTDSFGNTGDLDATILTTSTAYGGFDTQSVETLRYSSPMVFASGKRAIRRQDYNAMLQNQCGYLTSAVWGEYEEANNQGAYDSLMMNMVYYTGLKSYQSYPAYDIDTVIDTTRLISSANSSSGFWGSFSIRVKNTFSSSTFALLQDSGAQGLLFINDNEADPRDSLLPDWMSSTANRYSVTLPASAIASSGNGYSVNDELFLNNTEETIIVSVAAVDEDGGVTLLSLQTQYVDKDYVTLYGNPFSTGYVGGIGIGSGLSVNITLTNTTFSNVVSTNDSRGLFPEPVQLNPILNARSDQDASKYYQSLWEPALLNPVQIYFDFGTDKKEIAAIKFQASNPANGPFIGSFSMFATNIDPLPSTYNIRNNEAWECIIDRSTLNSPYGNLNEDWTDWLPTKCFNQEYDISGVPVYDSYRYFVIEVYSCGENPNQVEELVTFNKLKVLYSDEASTILYEDNAKLDIRFPVAGDPGPGDVNGRITKTLLNENDFPIYAYNSVIDGLTVANGYADGNILAYTFVNSEVSIPFLVEIKNISNGAFTTSIYKKDILAGNEYISLAGPQSLDLTPVYKYALTSGTGRFSDENQGTGYAIDDILVVDGTDGALRFRVNAVNGFGEILSITWIDNISLNTEYSGVYTTTIESSTSGATGTGAKADLLPTLASGNGVLPGAGAEITITSENNIKVDASFTGNRVDSASIVELDQYILEEYNHFTTYMEFKQPSVIQVSISLEVEIIKNSASPSAVVLQEVRNNILDLFAITPDFIGKGLKISDIYKAVINTPNVSACKVNNPLSNIEVANNTLMIPGSIVVTEAIDYYK